MELKNAVGVCVIALFSATIVLLTARCLDLQTAARLEPQLTRIADELQAIRKQGGIALPATAPTETPAPDDALAVFYFHGSIRCPTCRAIESQAHEVVESDFAMLVAGRKLVWKVFNYESPGGEELAKRFDVQMPVVVLARTKGSEIQEWRRLDKVWILVDDKPAFARYIRDEINAMLTASGRPPSRGGSEGIPTSPGPPAQPDDEALPGSPADIPVPQ
ncbi:MAG TPA: hypothetical protein EYP56_15580 [Planctomycetaceae bacterium]|nr:hypothetical protein [Planctomycetaceae bacterium]HIQ22838.1 hypothetical protein [Planctomycetota bacterium]